MHLYLKYSKIRPIPLNSDAQINCEVQSYSICDWIISSSISWIMKNCLFSLWYFNNVSLHVLFSRHTLNLHLNYNQSTGSQAALWTMYMVFFDTIRVLFSMLPNCTISRLNIITKSRGRKPFFFTPNLLKIKMMLQQHNYFVKRN